MPYALFSDALLPIVRKLEPATLWFLPWRRADLGYLFPNLEHQVIVSALLSGADPSEIRRASSGTHTVPRRLFQQPL